MKTLLAFLCVAAPKVIAGGGQFLLNLFLIRYFRPSEFGALSVCLTAILLFDSFLGSAIDMAIVRLAPVHVSRGDTRQSLRIQKAGLILKPVVIGTVAIPVIALSGQISTALFQHREFAYLITLMILALTTILILRSVQTYFQVAHRFGWYGGADLTHNVLRYGFVVYAARTGIATPGLVLATYSIAPLLVSTLLLISPARDLLLAKTNWASVQELLKVLSWFVPAAAFGGLTSRMDVFFVAHLAGVKEAGIFTAAQAIGLPVLLLGTYLSVIFSPRIMPQFQDGSLRLFYRNFQLLITGIALAGYGLLIIARAWFSTSLFPINFQGSWPILIVLFPSLLAGLVSFPLTISLLLFLKPRFLFVVDACGIPLLCSAYYLVTPSYGALGVAAVTTTYSLLKLGILQIFAWRLLDHPVAIQRCNPPGVLGFSERC